MRYRTFSIVALLTLALCIGANTAIFSVINTVLLRPLPFPEPGRLVSMYNSYPGVGVERAQNGAADYLDRRRATETFQAVTLTQLISGNIGAQGSPRRVLGMQVTPGYFEVFGVPVEHGRPFRPEEAELGRDQVVILSHELWQQLYAGDAGALGKTLRMDGESYEVVGIMPKGYDYLDEDVKLLVPFAFTEQQKTARHSNYADMFARLQPGVSLQQARSRIQAINAANAERFPEFAEALENAGFHTEVHKLHDDLVSNVRDNLWMLQLGVLAVLLIGCVNLANLMLARAQGRRKELAVRFAMGAGRGRVARQILAEGLVLALAGGLLGLAAGWGATFALGLFGVDQLPRSSRIDFDFNVLAFTVALAVLTGILFSVIPIIQVLRSSLESIFRESSRTGSGGPGFSRTRSALVVSQVGLAFVLLICSGLLFFSFQELLKVETGFRTESIHTARLGLPEQRYPDGDALRRFQERFLRRVRALPSVDSADTTSSLPLSGNFNTSVLTVEGYTLSPGENPPVPNWVYVSHSYFQTMGIDILQGRSFDSRDHEDVECRAVVDRHMAERYWQGREPVGGTIWLGMREFAEEGEEIPSCTVIGVAGQVKQRSLTNTSEQGVVYFSQRQYPRRGITVIVRTRGEQQNVLNAVQAELSRIDPELPLFSRRTMQERLRGSLVGRRAPMMLLAVFAAVALALSAVGIYGVLAYSVSQRTREIGIRMAMGARPKQVLGQVLGQGFRLVVTGLALGGVAAYFAASAMADMLFKVAPGDPMVYGAVAALLLAVALLACLVPSLRATRVNAVEALRWE